MRLILLTVEGKGLKEDDVERQGPGEVAERGKNAQRQKAEEQEEEEEGGGRGGEEDDTSGEK